MTDYNDGEWHLWDGSINPAEVHHESLVTYVWHDERMGKSGLTENMPAGRAGWPQVLKFRVTKPFQEPRVIWVNEYPSGVIAHQTEDAALDMARPNATRVAVRYVEAPE